MKTYRDSFMERVSPEPNTGCWMWMGFVDAKGYGRTRKTGAHRAGYEVLVGPIPDGLELDHTCNVHCCVNPDHLRPATRQENAKGRQRDQKFCKQGHAFTPENTRWDNRGWRQCRTCLKAAARKYTGCGEGSPLVARSIGGNCKNGHLLTTETWIKNSKGHRECRLCQRAYVKRSKEKRNAILQLQQKEVHRVL